MIFENRFDAGEKLAKELQEYKNKKDVVIVAIPRGALQIGAVLAKRLNLPMDVVFTKKLAFPGRSELAIGYVSESDIFVDPIIIERANIPESYIYQEAKKIKDLLRQRYSKYYQDIHPIELKNKTIILVDDGIATGNTIKGAIEALRNKNVKEIVVAVPVVAEDSLLEINALADKVVYLDVPENLMAIGQFYRNFDQVDDDDAITLLKESR
ncbi:MAG: Phosphoribosyl transferase domain-containing protein [candidate division TM6 bacterium GW2011_GWF2_32_72]|nr:MAG: Phosphoribosyl transferase domain-containing protein [candidate division TM6 bacterium GW2011_GWF2_32_72]